ncbi:transcriptional regulator family: Fungal Specific TF [Paecilomyces variotii]|nr:transcriptional regulator family: Fungal Specific TF [Paecilomyces variotii]KAJ9238869.1 transcriptional regulator family: Fungal Specific TF [Paecilomyces variotii]KAJ9247418.1 transcriptional regulator family: Fungal Specific TF [Paecilomyces variotii]KAJ9304471.1 transcriptional regulator family: Fungal Specific TF [Paecilomyces variotii]KAJ9378180.1 transcriptional regulator family: Fungal Specific TF [Paecilomyces variotii]
MASDSSHTNGASLVTPTDAQAPSPGTDSTKRKAESGSGTHTRAKRNRYISIACNECKRRKIKCNGQVPCQRCGHLNLECQYAPNCCSSNFKDSEEFKTMKQQIDSLQQQVNTLFTNLNSLRVNKLPSETPTFDALSRDGSHSASLPPHAFPSIQPSPAKSRMKPPHFRGPTSSAFNFDVAKSSLRTMGITQLEDAHDDTAHATPAGSPPQQLPAAPVFSVHPSKDPIWIIKREEAIRLCRVYEEEVGIMYPLINIEKVIQQTNLLYTFLEAATRTGFAERGLPGSDCLQDDDTTILKFILATTMIVEGNGENELGRRLFDSIAPVLQAKLWEPVDIKTIQLFALAATYYFHTDDEIMAYRLIGMTARMCFEMGLHRRDAMLKSFPNEEQWTEVTKTFWSIYSLDRRWSFGTGLPFVFQDEDIDPNLPEPDGTVPYLKWMVVYNRLCSKVWYSGLGSEGTTDIRRDEIGFLDYQVLQWYKQIPDNLKFYAVESPQNGESVSRGLRRLRVLLYLRMNHLRILIYRPVLHSAASIAENRTHAQAVVDIAKDTVRVLTRLNQTSDIYRTQQVCFNYFLVASLAVLLLAACHAPVDFNRQVRDEFYMALDLVNGFSAKSYVSKRLWKTIKGLRKTGEKLGLLARPLDSETHDAHSTAAVAMAGLAGHSIDDLSVYGQISGISELGNSPMNGLQISHELTNFFEAMGGYGNFASHPGADGINGFVGTEGELSNTGEGLPAILGGGGEFSRVMRELF